MSVRVEIENVPSRGSRIVVRFPYSEEAVARIKSISGSTWNKPGRFWHFPIDLTACQMLRQAFPDLTIGPDLWKWATNEQQTRTELGQLHAATSAEPVDCPIVRESYPTMWNAMLARGYQTLVVQYVKQVGSFFNGSQPGTGKTIETLASLAECERHGNILIIAPKKAIQATWPREVEKWLTPDASTSVMVCDAEQGSMDERDAMLAEFAAEPGDAKFRFVLIHPEMLSWEFICDYIKPNQKRCNGKMKTCPKRGQHDKRPLYPSLFKIVWDGAVIMDETHKFMMHANERSGSVSGWGYGAQKLKTSPSCIRIGMSGTPFKGKPRRFWPMLHWLRPDRYTGQRKWEQTYFETETDFYTGNQNATDVMREDRRNVFEADLGSIMIRHTKRELRKLNSEWAPPEKLHVDVLLPMDPKQAKAYEGMVKDASARLADGSLDAVGILAERTRCKQLASAYATSRGGYTPSLPSNKWDWIVNALEERGLVGKVGVVPAVNDGDVKIIIASQWVALLEVFAEELERMDINYFTIFGKDRNTQAVEDEWQSDQTHTRVLLLSKAAGGFSLTLDAADDVFKVDPAENPDDDEQVEDRAHRTSRTDHQVTIYNLISEGTIEESIASGNLLMDVTQKAVLDGRRGVEYARLTLEGGKAA